MPSFAKVWADLVTGLRPGSELKGWSRDKGDTGLRFKVDEIGDTWISVISPRTGNVRRVSKGDIDKVFAFWSEYKNGRIGRAEMAQASQNTSYIFGMLRWHEQTRN